MERFLVDHMLMRLGRWLRLLGQDVANPEDESDQDLLQRARSERRTLVTRDKRLAHSCQVSGADCILIESSQLEDQLLQMAGYGIRLELSPLRCTICNSPLNKAESEEKEMWRCEGCGKLYWEGSHWRKIEEMLQMLRSRVNQPLES